MTELDRLRQKYETAKAMEAHAKRTYGVGSWCHMAAVETTLEAYQALAQARGVDTPTKPRA